MFMLLIAQANLSFVIYRLNCCKFPIAQVSSVVILTQLCTLLMTGLSLKASLVTTLALCQCILPPQESLFTRQMSGVFSILQIESSPISPPPPPYNTLSLIYYIFSTDNLIPQITEAEIHDIAISDHAQINNHVSENNPWLRCFPSYLSDNTDLQTFMGKAWEEFSSTNSDHKDNPNLFWEAGKAFLRYRVISYAASFLKKALTNYREASSHLNLAQRLLWNNTPKHKSEWHEAK